MCAHNNDIVRYKACSALTLLNHLTLVMALVVIVFSNRQNPDMIVSSSRDKTIIVWKLQRGEDQYGYPHRSLTGHSHFVSEVVISSDGQFAL